MKIEMVSDNNEKNILLLNVIAVNVGEERAFT